MRSQRLKTLMTALLLFAAASAAAVAQSDDLQNGDFLVGVTVDQGFGGVEGRIVRVRNGESAVFCAPTIGSADFPGYWNTPRDVVIDSQGRVVFLAYLHGNEPVLHRGWGLWRCDAMGATPTMLGAFGSDANPVLANYPRPLGNRGIQFVGGLHLKITKGMDLNTMTMFTSEYYVFAIADVNGTQGLAETIAYDPETGDWNRDFDDPVPTDRPGAGPSQLDMINANGYTFSVAGNAIRGVTEPIRLDFQIGEFDGGLAFQSLHDFHGIAIDDRNLSNLPSSCPPHADGVSLSLPTATDGVIYPLNGMYQVAWRDGFLLHNQYGGGGALFLPSIGLELFDLIPTNDLSAMYHDNFSCSHQQKLDFTGWHQTLSDSDGTYRGVTRLTPNGTAGTQNYPYPNGGQIVGVGPAHEVVILADGLNGPVGIDVYPGFLPPVNGITFFVRIDSPVDVLITAPDGRRIGVDPATGLYVNDYGDAGYDSQTNEPHIYGIRDPQPGDYTITTKGTGTGPYTITTYGANLGTGAIARAIFTGGATPGSVSSHEAGLTSDGVVTGDAPIDVTPPIILGLRSPDPNENGWNRTPVTITFQCTDDLSGLAAGSPPSPMVLSANGAGQSATGTCTDVAGNSASATVQPINIDSIAPALTAPPNQSVLQVSPAGATVTYPPPTMLETGSGLASSSCAPASGDVFPLGLTTVNCTATDLAGNTGVATFTVTVEVGSGGYPFSGFFGAVDNPPTVNEVAAGRGLALTFGLGGDHGLAIFAAGYPASRQMSCNTSAVTDQIEETIAATSSFLAYKSDTNLYTYAWKTSAAWAGTCRELTLRLADGSEHRAFFRFR